MNISFSTYKDVPEGFAFWNIAAQTSAISLRGGDADQLRTASAGVLAPEPPIVAFLRPGRNQVSSSTSSASLPLETAFVTDGTNMFQVIHPDNPFTNRSFKEFTGHIINPYTDATSLKPGKGCWLLNKTNNELVLVIGDPGGFPTTTALLPPFVNETTGSAALIARALSTRQERAASSSQADPAPPPPPAAGLSASVTGSAGGGGSAAGGCFIATAAIGSTRSPQLQRLRSCRDQTLAPSSIGRAFIKTYYAESPPVAQYLRTRATARCIVRRLLRLQQKASLPR